MSKKTDDDGIDRTKQPGGSEVCVCVVFTWTRLGLFFGLFRLASWSCGSCILDSPSSRYVASGAITAPRPSPNSAIPTGAYGSQLGAVVLPYPSRDCAVAINQSIRVNGLLFFEEGTPH